MYMKVLMFVILASGVYSNCTEKWRFDEESNVCLRHIQLRLTWAQARTYCQNLQAELVQIWTMSKQNFLSMDPSGTLVSHVWIGISDLDKDGLHEYVNGSKVVGDVFWDVPPTRTETQTCVALSPLQSMWKALSCSQHLGFICEIELDPGNSTLDVACSPESCVCNPDSWVYFEMEDRYFIVNRIAKNFYDSSDLCKRLAGQLLTIPSILSGYFLKNKNDLWTTTNSLYWVGLSLGPDKRWAWSDGTSLGIHSEWAHPPSSNLGCVAVIWDADAKWRDTDCNSENFHVCETKVLCQPIPGIVVNNKKIHWQGSSVMIENDQLVWFECTVAGGSADGVKEAKLECYGKEPKVAFGEKWAKLSVKVDVVMNQRKCTCELSKTDGTKDASDVLIDFKSTPQLLREKDNNKKFIIPGSVKVLNFTVMAIPEPTTLSVVKQSKLVDGYKVDFTNGTDLYVYVVSVHIKGYSYHQIGPYVLVIGNGYGDNLRVIFNLDVPCCSFPVLTFNGGETLENTTTLIINRQNVTINCKLRGYRARVTQITVSCDHHENVTTEEKTAEGVFIIDVIMKGNHCRCESVQNNGRKEVAYVKINFKSSPLLVDFENRSLAFLIEAEKKGVLNFTVFAIPGPSEFLLTETEFSEVNPYGFIITMEPSEILYHYTASILIKDFTIRESGEYNLTVGNRIGDNLSIVFTVDVKEEGVFDVTFGSIIIVLMLVILSVVLFVVAICCKAEAAPSKKTKKRKNRSMDSSSSDTSSTSTDSIDEAATECSESGSSDDDDDSDSLSGRGNDRFSSKKSILPSFGNMLFGRRVTLKNLVKKAVINPKKVVGSLKQGGEGGEAKSVEKEACNTPPNVEPALPRPTDASIKPETPRLDEVGGNTDNSESSYYTGTTLEHEV